MKPMLKQKLLLIVLALMLSFATSCETSTMQENPIKVDFCSAYTVVPTLHCQNVTKYKVPGQPPEKFVHCTKVQEENVDKNNAVYDSCF